MSSRDAGYGGDADGGPGHSAWAMPLLPSPKNRMPSPVHGSAGLRARALSVSPTRGPLQAGPGGAHAALPAHHGGDGHYPPRPPARPSAPPPSSRSPGGSHPQYPSPGGSPSASPAGPSSSAYRALPPVSLFRPRRRFVPSALCFASFFLLSALVLGSLGLLAERHGAPARLIGRGGGGGGGGGGGRRRAAPLRPAPLPELASTVRLPSPSPAAAALSAAGRRRRRVLLVSQDVAGPILNGGIGTAIRNLASKLSLAGHNVSVLYSLGQYVSPENPRTWDQWVAHYREAYDVALHSTPPDFSYTTPESDPVVARAYEAYLWLASRDGQYDFVHCPEWQGTCYFALLAKRQGLRFRGTVFVTQAHSSSMWAMVGNRELPTHLAFFDADFLERGCVRLADYLLTPSRYMVQWMATNGWAMPEGRTYVQWNTMAIGQGGGDAASRLDPGPADAAPPEACFGAAQFSFFGRLEERKGLFVFLDAIELLAKGLAADAQPHQGGLVVHLLGKALPAYKAEMEARLGALAALGVNATLHTQLDVEQTKAFLLGHPCRVAVMPSLFDNLPFTVLECLINRVRFLASDSGGGPELIHPSMVANVTFRPTAKDLHKALARAWRSGVPLARPARTMAEVDAVWGAWHEQTEAAATPPAAPWRPTGLLAAARWLGAAGGSAAAALPFVSVVMVTFNRDPDILLQAVTSLAVQDYPASRFEVVLVNDAGSSLRDPPELASLLLLFQQRGWPVVELAENAYLGAARNEGVRHAAGDWLMFMDDDNVAKPHELRTFVEVRAQTGADVLTCHVDIFDTPGAPPARSTVRWIPTGNTETSWAVNSMGDANFFTSRAVFDALGGFTPDRLAFEDWEFLITASLTGHSVEVVPEPLFWKRQSSNSMLREQDPYASAMRSFRPFYAWTPGNAGAALLLAKVAAAAPQGPVPAVDTDLDFALYQGHKGLRYGFRFAGAKQWQDLLIAPRPWAPDMPAFVAETEETHFGPLAAHRFAMHPARFSDAEIEVAKLWSSPVRGEVTAHGVVVLTDTGGGGVVFRMAVSGGAPPLVEHVLNDTSPRLEFTRLASLDAGQELQFSLSVLGHHHYFCGTWTRFEVMADGRAPGQGGGPPLLPPRPLPEPDPPCDLMPAAAPRDGGPAPPPFCLPKIFIVGAAQCGTHTLAASLVAASGAVAAPAEAGEREHFSEHHHSSASVVAYARALGPTDGFSVTTFDRSPSYLSSRRAAAAVARLAPSARAVIAVCDPTPRLWAFYHHARSFRANGSTTSAAEAAAAAAAAAAAGGEGVSPRSVADFAAPLFDLPWPEFVETIRTQPLAHGGLFESGQYERQEQLWAAALGPARVHLWHRDAYAADPGPATRALLRFLGLPPARGVDLDGGGGGEPGAARLPEVDAPPPGLPPMGEAERAAVEPHYAASWKGVTERLLARGGG